MRSGFWSGVRIIAAVAAVAVIGAGEAKAALITYDFTGTVTSTAAGFPVSLPVGTTLSGTYTFNSTTAPVGGSTSTTAVFNALTSLTISAAGFTDTTVGAAEIQTGNKDGVTETTDRYSVVARASDGLSGSFNLGNGGAQFILRLDQAAGTLFSTALSLPTTVTLADFDGGTFFIFDSTGDLVIGSLTSFGPHVVPEPGSFLLFGAGLLALGLGLRRRRG